MGIHKELMQSGVYVEYNSHFRWKAADENWTLVLLEELLTRYADRIILGMDMRVES